MEQEGVDQASARVSRGWMHHHARWFVDDDEVVVLEHDVQRDVLGGDLGGWRRDDLPADHPVPDVELVRRLGRDVTVDDDAAALDALDDSTSTHS